MAKKTAKSTEAAKRTKAAKPKQGASLGEQDIRRVVEKVMAELAEAPGWAHGCHPPMNVEDHVVRQGEVLWLLDYFIKVATSLRMAIELAPKSKGWMQGC